MLKVVRKNSEQVDVQDESGCNVETFIIKEDLQRALDLLKQINRLKTKSGLPIYNTVMYKNISTWSFHQSYIFWYCLRNYVKQESLIKYLSDKDYKIDENFTELSSYLVFKTKSKTKLIIVIKTILARLLAFKVTLWAVLKTVIWQSKVLIYTPDKFSPKSGCDFRFQPVYDFLNKKNIKYIEIFHSLLNRDFLKNLFKRKRPAFYLEALTLTTGQKSKIKKEDFDLSGFNSYTQEYIFNILQEVDSRARTSIKNIKSLSRILKCSSIKSLIAVDDPRHVGEIITACRENNIKTYGIEHGHFTKYHVGWFNYELPVSVSVAFDKLFTWNDYWKKNLLKYSSYYNDDNVEVGGWLRRLPKIDYNQKPKPINDIKQVGILIPYEMVSAKSEVVYFIEKFVELGMQVYFKIRPDVEPDEQLKQYGIEHLKNIKTISNIDADSLEKFDLTAGVYTTFLDEMLYYDKPIMVLQTSFDLGHQLLDDGLAKILPKEFTAEDILDYINNYKSAKDLAWPLTKNIEETLNKILC